MSRSLTFIGLAAVGGVGLVLVESTSSALAQVPAAAGDAQAAKAAEAWVKNNPRGRTTAQEHPVVKDNLCLRVSPEEREVIGLPAPTWVARHGKVQPAVREALEHQKKLIESGDPRVEFQGDRPGGFQGTAYVDIYLRHEARGEPTSKENQAAIKEVETRLLRELTAKDFSLVFAFTSSAAIAGYANDKAVAKLADDRDVIAIGLDDQPRPAGPPGGLDEPEVRQAVPAPTERRGKVEVPVYEALGNSSDGYVAVIVSIPCARLGPSFSWDAYNARETESRKLQDRVLAALTAEEFKVTYRSTSFFVGYVTTQGLGKLVDDAHVKSVGVVR